MGFISTTTKNMQCVCNLFGWSIMEEFVSGSVYDDALQGLSECDLDLISFANELILLRDFQNDLYCVEWDVKLYYSFA